LIGSRITRSTTGASYFRRTPPVCDESSFIWHSPQDCWSWCVTMRRRQAAAVPCDSRDESPARGRFVRV
jgi:hypothetical protein